MQAFRTKNGNAKRSRLSMPAYLECGQCAKHSEIDGNGGEVKCPHCGSTHVGQLEMGGGVPSWFKKDQQ